MQKRNGSGRHNRFIIQFSNIIVLFVGRVHSKSFAGYGVTLINHIRFETYVWYTGEIKILFQRTIPYENLLGFEGN